MDITTLDQFKDEIYGVKGTPRRDNLERELETLQHWRSNPQCPSEERNDAGTTGRAH